MWSGTRTNLHARQKVKQRKREREKSQIIKKKSIFSIMLSVLVLLGFVVCSAAGTGPIVTAPAGQFEGFEKDGVNAFRGIRYGVAPVGDKRWKAPEAEPPVAGLYNATLYGNSCWQPASQR
jgi:hypothetical protein